MLVYTGPYASSLALRAILDDHQIASSFEDLPGTPHGHDDSRIYVPLRDVQRVLPLVAEFRSRKSEKTEH